MKVPPPLDMHAHLATDIAGKDVRELGAFLFSVTRSLEEYAAVAHRTDLRTRWGIGVHPKLARSVKGFDSRTFEHALRSAHFVGEVGLDGSSRVPMVEQKRVLRAMFERLQDQPRVVSIHSTGAHFHILRELHRTPIEGAVLHWWTGDPELTEEAVRLGCFFSVPPAMMASPQRLAHIPPTRILFETDHPYGDRRGPGPRRPGAVHVAEDAFAAIRGIHQREVRIESWRTFRALLDSVNGLRSLPEEWQVAVARLE